MVQPTSVQQPMPQGQGFMPPQQPPQMVSQPGYEQQPVQGGYAQQSPQMVPQPGYEQQPVQSGYF